MYNAKLHELTGDLNIDIYLAVKCSLHLLPCLEVQQTLIHIILFYTQETCLTFKEALRGKP